MRVLVAASLGLALVLPGSAAATVGSLDFRDCVSSDAATTGCSNVSATSTALDAVTHALAVSADGTSVYAAATPDAVVHFARDLATGALTFRDCIAGGDLPATGCSNISATTDSLESPTAIALAGNDRDVYVAGLNGVAHLTRDPITGVLTFADCISSIAATKGCTHVDTVTAAVSSFDGLRLGSDEHSVYAAGGNRLVHLTRSAIDGSLLFTDCLSGGSVPPCTDLSAGSKKLDLSEAIAPTADGKTLYVGASDIVYNLSLDAAGSPSFVDCLSTDATLTGCTILSPSVAFDGLENIALSPDGANAYVTADHGGLSTLSRHAGGTLTFDSCITSVAVPGCTDVSASNGAFSILDGITIAPDNRSVYTTGEAAVAHLLRDPATGALTPAGCISGGAIVGCTDITGQTNAVVDLQEVTLSPGGQSAYVAAEATDAVLHFSRQLSPTCSDGSTAVAHDTATMVPLACTDANGDALTRSIATAPLHGTLGAIDQGAASVLYTPSLGFAGADAFSFTASDGRDASAPAIAALTVGAGSPPATKDTTAPVITRLSAKAKRTKRGGTVRFTLSEKASVTITIQRKRGRRYATAGSFKKSAAKGANRKAFGGKLAKRKLKPGRYRVRARATDAAGNRSKTRSASFRVKS